MNVHEFRVAGVSLFEEAPAALVHDDGSPITMACVVHAMRARQAVALGRYSGLGYCHTCGRWVRSMT